MTQSVVRARISVLAAIRANQRAWIAAGALSLALLLLPEILRLDGKPHADWLQFLGRFHPLAVHLPIGLIVLVPVLEIAGGYRPALREAAGFVLALACLTCLGTLILGYVLAYGSGETGTTVSRHMWGGIVLAIGLLFCLLARPLASAGGPARIYPALLCGVMLALLWRIDHPRLRLPDALHAADIETGRLLRRSRGGSSLPRFFLYKEHSPDP